MNLFDIILKLISTLNLVVGEKYNTLYHEVQEWEKGCVVDHEDKVKSLYARIHKGVLFKLITPFLYFFLLNWVKNITAPPTDNFLDD